MVVSTKPWWQFTPDNPSGSYGKIIDPGPGNPTYLKPDVNIAVPPGTPITSAGSGIVTDVTDHGRFAGGLSVVVKLDTPLNKLATHVAYNFLGSATAHKGQRVSSGQQVGVAGSPYGILFALALTSDDTWGNGTFYLNARGEPLLDPHILLSLLNTGKLPAGTGIGLTIGSTSSPGALGALAPLFLSVSNNTHDILNDIPGFSGICDALDNAEQFTPFRIVNSGGQDLGIIGHLPFVGPAAQAGANLITLPQDTIQALLTFITANTMAALFRLLIMFVGLAIIFTLIRNAFVHGVVSAENSESAQVARQLMMIAQSAQSNP
jgi:hypothetical protein